MQAILILMLAAEFLVLVPGSSGKLYDKGQADIAIVNAQGLDATTFPENSGAGLWVKAALRADAVVDDIGTDPTNAQKIATVSSLADFDTCNSFLGDPGADLATAPKCYATWTDTTFTDCSTLTKCLTPGAQLCGVVGGTHVQTKMNPGGSVCGGACSNPAYRVRIKCP